MFRCETAPGNGGGTRRAIKSAYIPLKIGSTVTYDDGTVWRVAGCNPPLPPK